MNNNISSQDWPVTKRKIVDAGVNLMRSRGFNATTLDDICAAAGVTKGGFFHYFKSKEEIAKAALERFAAGKSNDFQNAEFRKVTDSLERLFARLDFVVQSIGGTSRVTKGCLIGMLAQELSASNPALRAACQASFVRVAQDFENDLIAAKADYAPKASFDTKSVATLYVAIIQGSLMLAKSSESNRVLAENIEHFRRYLQFLFGKRNPNPKHSSAIAARN